MRFTRRSSDRVNAAAAYVVEALEQRLVPSVAPAGVEFPVNVATAGRQQRPAIAADGDGDFVVAWASQNQDGSGDGVYARRFDAAGNARQVPGAAAGVTEFRVNTSTLNNQRKAAVAMDADGDFVVAWEGARPGSGYRVYAQRYNAAGAPQGGEFQVSVDTAALSQRAPSVAMDADGDFVIAWESFGQDFANTYGIYARRFDADGAPRQAPGAAAGVSEFLVNFGVVIADQRHPAAAMDADGDFVVMWDDAGGNDGSGHAIIGRQFDAAGNARQVQGGAPGATLFRANATTADDQLLPSVAMDAGGDCVVAWQSFGQDAPSGYGVYATRFSAAGFVTLPEFRVNTATAGTQSLPSVALDAAGGFVVAWDSAGQDGGGYGVYAQRYDAAGAALARPTGAPAGQGATEFRVNATTADTQSRPAVAVDPDGDVVVAWQSFGQDGSVPASYGVYAQRYAESVDATGPIVASVTLAGKRVTPGLRLRSTPGGAVITFSEGLNTTGGTGGVNSVTNPANWALTRNGQPVPSGIASVTFALNATTGKHTATLTFAPALTPGDYVLTAREAIRDAANNALDGNLDGDAGGDHALAFTVRQTAAVGGEFPVNVTTAGRQLDAAVAMDADGDFVVAWASLNQDGSGYGVYARRFDAAGDARQAPGAPAGVTEFRVNATTDNQQDSPTVAMDAVGNFVVAWESIGQDGSGDGIYARRYDAAGNPLGGEIPVNTTTAGFQVNPAVAMDADGDFVVAWQSADQDGSHYGIYARRYDAAGNPLGGEIPVNTTTVDFQVNPAVATDAGGDFVIAWESFGQDGGGRGIYARRYDAAGNPLSGEIPVNTTTVGQQASPAVAMDAAGDFVVAWQSAGQDGSFYGVYARRYEAAGSPLGGEIPVNATTAGSQIAPSVAMDAGGDFVVAWQSYGQDDDTLVTEGVYAQRYDAAGNPLGGEFRVNTTTADDQRAPAVAMDAGGDFVVAWESFNQDGSGLGVYAQRYAVPIAAPTIRINDGSAQRSKVNEITITFDQAIGTDGGTAFTLTGRNGAGAGTTFTAFNDNGDGRTYQLRFSGSPIVGGSLADGIYDLVIAATRVHVPGDRASGLAADVAFEFHRLYSDTDNDGDSDNADLFQMRSTYNKFSSDPAYKWFFDYNGDLDVDNADVFQVRSRRSIVFQNY